MCQPPVHWIHKIQWALPASTVLGHSCLCANCRCNQLEWLMGNITASTLIPLFAPALGLPLPSLVSYRLSSRESFLSVHRGSEVQPLQSVKEVLSCRKGSWGDGLQTLTHQICIFGAHTKQRSFVFKACSHRSGVYGGLYGLQKQHCCEVWFPQMSVPGVEGSEPRPKLFTDCKSDSIALLWI